MAAPKKRLPVTATFQRELREALTTFGAQAKISRATGYSATAIRLLASDDAPERSQMVGPICEYMGWSPPTVAVRAQGTPLGAEWVSVMAELEALSAHSRRRLKSLSAS